MLHLSPSAWRMARPGRGPLNLYRMSERRPLSNATEISAIFKGGGLRKNSPGITPEGMGPGGLRMARRGPPPPRAMIYPFLHRNGEKGPQGPGKRPSGVER